MSQLKDQDYYKSIGDFYIFSEYDNEVTYKSFYDAEIQDEHIKRFQELGKVTIFTSNNVLYVKIIKKKFNSITEVWE